MLPLTSSRIFNVLAVDLPEINSVRTRGFVDERSMHVLSTLRGAGHYQSLQVNIILAFYSSSKIRNLSSVSGCGSSVCPTPFPGLPLDAVAGVVSMEAMFTGLRAWISSKPPIPSVLFRSKGTTCSPCPAGQCWKTSSAMTRRTSAAITPHNILSRRVILACHSPSLLSQSATRPRTSPNLFSSSSSFFLFRCIRPCNASIRFCCPSKLWNPSSCPSISCSNSSASSWNSCCNRTVEWNSP